MLPPLLGSLLHFTSLTLQSAHSLLGPLWMRENNGLAKEERQKKR